MKKLSLEQLVIAVAKLDSDRLQFERRRAEDAAHREREQQRLNAELEQTKAERDQLHKERKRFKAEQRKMEMKRAELSEFQNEIVAQRNQIEQERKDLNLKKQELEAICNHLDQREEVQLQRDQLAKDRQKIEADVVEAKRERTQVQRMREELKLQKGRNAKEAKRIELKREELEKESAKLVHLKQELELKRTALMHQKDKMTRNDTAAREALQAQIQKSAAKLQEERENLLRDKEYVKDAMARRHKELDSEAKRLAEDRRIFQKRVHELQLQDTLPLHGEQEKKTVAEICTLLTDLGELWELFDIDDSQKIADGLRMQIATVQLNQIRKDWTNVVSTCAKHETKEV